MKFSQLFTRTSKNVSRDVVSLNAQLLTRAGYVDQLMAGVYSYLPLGLRVLRRIENVVRTHMDSLGAQEVLMPILHPKSIWETTGGWDSIDVLFKLKSRTGNDYALGQSEEEVVTPLVMSRAPSYKNLPVSVYQIHWKYRDELRAKSGILRGREFYMKDMYSFHASQDDFDRYYQRVKAEYLKIYDELGLEAKVTEASGGSFSEKISYEFMVLTDAGEDDILYSEQSDYCINSEIAKVREGDEAPDGSGPLRLARASEVGNVFDLGQKYGKAFDLGYTDEKGERHFPIVGCFGLGISRVMGVIAEHYHDEHGLIWPESVAPFRYHIVALMGESVEKVADKVYDQLGADECLFDDREGVSAGEKFADADLLGCPIQVVVSAKTLAESSVEVISRSGKFDKQLVKLSTLRSLKDL